jgi:hypothetical protein
MKHHGIFIAATLLCSQVMACPAADSLIERYGISFSGFTTPIPLTTPPTARTDALSRVVLPNKKGYVMDGYRHAAVIDVSKKQAWIHRTGGFLGVYEWYGPVDIENVSLVDCKVESQAVMQPAANLQ